MLNITRISFQNINDSASLAGESAFRQKGNDSLLEVFLLSVFMTSEYSRHH